MSQIWLHLRNKNQVDSDATVAKGEISKATNEDGINTAKNTGLTNISNDVKAADAQNLQDAKDAANKALDSYGQAAKDKIASMPGLTSDQIKEADTKIDQAVADGHANINKATDFAGVNSALADAEKSIDGVSETFQNESGKVITNQSNDNGNDVTKTHNYHKLDKIILIV